MEKKVCFFKTNIYSFIFKKQNEENVVYLTKMKESYSWITLTLVTLACFSVGETSEVGGNRPSPFEDTEWSDKKIYNKTFFLKVIQSKFA